MKETRLVKCCLKTHAKGVTLQAEVAKQSKTLVFQIQVENTVAKVPGSNPARGKNYMVLCNQNRQASERKPLINSQ